MNFTNSGPRPEIARSQSQNQSPIANGYNQGHQSFQARHKETNLLGVDTAPRGLSVLDSPIGNGPDFHQKNPLRLESTESPKNYDFFGVQQHISGQHPLQSLPKQQSGMTDMQLLQQHAIMQELLRQQLPKPRFHLPETRQLSSTNQVSTVAKQVSDGVCPVPINGVPVRDALNYTWQPEHMTPNANWLQHGASPAMQGSSGGLIFSPEQSQKHLMGLVPQQVDQSFYGISTGSARGNPYQYSYVQMDKALMHQVPADSNSFPEPSYGTKSVTHMPAIPNLSEGLKGHDQGYFGQSTYTCHTAGESTGTEKGIQVDKVPFDALTSHLKWIDDSSERAQTIQLGIKSAHRIPKTSPDNGFYSSETSFPSRTGNQNHARDPGPQFPVLEAITKMLDVWTSVSSPEHLLGEKLDVQIARAGNSGKSEFPTGVAKPQSFVGEEQPEKSRLVLHENNAIQNPTSMQRDIEPFGRSLRPNNAVHQNYSLLHQVQAMKNTEVDPSNRSVKRFKGPPPDSGLDVQQLSSQGAEQLSNGSNSMIRDALVGRPLVPSGDSKMLSCVSKTGDNHETQVSANNMLPFVRNDSQHFSNSENSVSNVSGEHSKISPQMAPSWFDRYGAIKNGKILPIYNARKIATMNATEKPFIAGQSSDSLHVHSSEQVNAAADASPLDKAPKCSSFMPIASEFISPRSLPPDIANKNLVVRAKKRKSMIYEFLPWHKEVTQDSQRLQDISVAEVEWAHAANRLIEKVDNEPEMVEDWWPSVLRSKRRLVLTTHLMQQLLRAPPRVFLCADAIKNYESLAYFVTRSILGDACSTAYIPESNTAVSPVSGSMQSLCKARGGEKSIHLKGRRRVFHQGKDAGKCFTESGQKSLNLGLKTGMSRPRESFCHQSFRQVL